MNNIDIKIKDWENIVFFDVEKFELTGFPWRRENADFNRIPNRIMNKLPDSLSWVAPQPSGGMIRFWTNSKRIVMDVELLRNETSKQCTKALLSGFDFYINGEFFANLCGDENTLTYKAQADGFPEGQVTLYTPLQNTIKSIKIGLEEEAVIKPPNEFDIKRPILFYGSSITCGFSASRPGLTYPARIARSLNANFINFGFGGCAKGETEIANIISEQELSLFIMDYDHNAPDVKHLADTHEVFFNIIREKQPLLPIIIITSPNFYKLPKHFAERRDVIKRTYDNAVSRGDKNVYFIDGKDFYPSKGWQDYTTDCLHPNDMGFSEMAKRILPVVKKILL